MRRARSAFLVCCVVLAASAVRADVQKLAIDGCVHRITVESSASRSPLATQLRHTIHRPDGSLLSSALIAGTDDPAADREPALEIDPNSGELVLVWSRNDGSGFDVVASRWVERTWQPWRPVLTHAVDDEVRPQLAIGSNLIHVVARREGTSPAYVRASLDRRSFSVVFGPEVLPLDSPSVIDPEGEDQQVSPEPPEADRYLASELVRTASGESRVIIWGARDEPTPIDYCQAFKLQSPTRELQRVRAAWIEDRFVLSYVAGDRFQYAVRGPLGWSDLRSILLNDQTSATDARLQMEEMIRRHAFLPPS